MKISHIWHKMKELWNKMEKLYPPGYAYKTEIDGKGALFGLGLGISLQFFARLHDAYEELFVYIGNTYMGETEMKYVLRSGAISEPFVDLVQGYWWWYLPWLISLVLTIVLHYMYYYRGTKSIYVMRRLKSPIVMIKSCVMGPFVQLVMGAVIMVGWYFMYYGIYLLVIPVECMPRYM